MLKILHIASTLILCSVMTTLSAQNINIPDGTFKSRLIAAGIDKNGDGEIQESEALEVTKINIGLGSISSAEGIQYFTNLVELSISGNRLETIDLSSLTKLESLNLNWNRLTTLDVNNLSELRYLNCGRNYITSLDIKNLSKLATIGADDSYNLLDVKLSDLPSLKKFSARYGSRLISISLNNLDSLENVDGTGNKISEITFNNTKNLKSLSLYQNSLWQIDLSKQTLLESLSLGRNGFTELDLSGLNQLKSLYCEENKISKLNLGNLSNLTYLSCYSNLLTTLDISNSPLLEEILVFENPLESIIIKNGIDNTTGPYFEEYFDVFNRNPTLKYVCADKEELETLRQMALFNEREDVILTSFCNSTVEGSYSTISGGSKIDFNKNGCYDDKSVYPHLKLNISNSTDFAYILSGSDGNFSINLKPGTYNIQPILEHPSYFSINPSSSSITLPDTISPTFCITPKGNFNDLAISIIPVRAARPGFSDAQYKIVYKNQGTTTLGGSINFTFDDNRMNVVNSSPISDDVEMGLLNFDFNNLTPFETRTILITMRANAPTENPAVNVGDILDFTVKINTREDQTPEDNIAVLAQTVIGSYDPNDKTCLEGDIITPEMVGRRVNYLIRFENTGTANAENVVVTDFIDTTVFDISSLLINSTSHTCHTQISNDNKVQFIFSDIQLPFTEPDKHGHVAFSILLKDHLQIGDSIRNQADIFFDYNLPITTNEAISEINYKTVTSVQQKISDASLAVYPNPSNGNIFFEIKNTSTQPIKISVLDITGKVVHTQVYNHQQGMTSMQLGKLAKGTYVIRAESNDGTMTKKFVIQ